MLIQRFMNGSSSIFSERIWISSIFRYNYAYTPPITLSSSYSFYLASSVICFCFMPLILLSMLSR